MTSQNIHPTPPKDWSGEKYDILQELGEDVDILVLAASKSTPDTQTFAVSHAQGDGLAILHRMFKRLAIPVDSSVKSVAPPTLSFWKKLRLVRTHLQSKGAAIHYPWKVAVRTDYVQNDTELSYSFLTPSQYSAIQAYYTQQGVGETSYLLASVDRVCQSLFLSAPSDRIWMMPHDVRASLNLNPQHYDPTRGNYTASMYLRLPAHGADAHYINQLRKQLYKANVLTGAWLYSNVSKYLPKKIIQKVYLNMPKPAWFGVYSNLGNWQPSQPSASGDALLLGFVSPMSKIMPIYITMTSWQNQPCLVVQVHPMLVSATTSSSILLTHWLSALFTEVGINDTPTIVTESLLAVKARAQRLA